MGGLTMKITINKEKKEQEIPEVPFVFKHKDMYLMAILNDDDEYQFVRLNGDDKGTLCPLKYYTKKEMLMSANNDNREDKIVDVELIIRD